MKVRTNELTRHALDWAVAKCEGPNSVASCYLDDNDQLLYLDEASWPTWEPSIEWSQGGPLIERERIGVEPWGGDAFWVAMTYNEGGMTLHKQFGPTPLIAAMRCYVASKLGDEVEVPDGIN